ncbi:MAG TPA: TonB family protein [Terracidiphilus sp.]|nr:TonB family protein [Terracidiphilus sp.]
MPVNQYPVSARFGLLPEPEGRSAPFVTSALVNLAILSVALYVGMMAKHVIEHKYEQTELIFPTKPPPQPKVKVKMPPPPKAPELPKPAEVKLEAPKMHFEREKPKPALKPLEMEAKVKMPEMRAARPAIVLAPQPKAALTAAAPALVKQEHPSTTAVHLGEMHGVIPNEHATRAATVAALGNPYGGMNGAAAAPRGVVGSTGIGDGTRSGSNAGAMGRVAQAGLPGGTGTAEHGGYGGHVASAGIPRMTTVAPPTRREVAPASTSLEVLSKPPVRYTAEARELKVEGNVILRVTFTASGHVVVDGVVHGLGHGLDEEARRVAQKIRFRPATRNGQAVDLTTNITITFQLA